MQMAERMAEADTFVSRRGYKQIFLKPIIIYIKYILFLYLIFKLSYSRINMPTYIIQYAQYYK